MLQHLRWILQPFLGKRATIRVSLAVALLGSIAGGCGPYLRSVDPEPYHVLAGREQRELFLFDVTHRFLWMASLQGYLSAVEPTQQNLKLAMRQGMRVTPVLEDGPPEQATLLWAVLRLRQGLVEKSDLTWVLSTRPLVLAVERHGGSRWAPGSTQRYLLGSLRIGFVSNLQGDRKVESLLVAEQSLEDLRQLKPTDQALARRIDLATPTALTQVIKARPWLQGD